MTETLDEYERGYAQQTAWLAGKTLTEMEVARDARDGTVDNRIPFNQGATDATIDLIGAMKVAIRSDPRADHDENGIPR